MKILYLNFDRGIPVLGDKGASVHVREFVRAAADLGHEVLIACTRRGEGNAPPPAAIAEFPIDDAPPLIEAERRSLGIEDRGDGEPILRRELARLAHDQSLAALVLASLAARDFRPDFIYERHALFSSAGAGLAARLECPRILEVNAPLADEQKAYRGLALEALARRMEAASFGSATAVVAVSERVAAYVRAVAAPSAGSVLVIPNGVDLGRFAAADASRERVRSHLGWGPEACVLGFVGSFKPWHGTETLFDVYERLVTTHPAVRLLGVGDGPALADLRARAARSPAGPGVALVGRVPHVDIPAWTAAIDVVVAPYHAAGNFYFSPLKVVEALAGGRPVVAPRLGQLGDLIEHGRTGLLYSPDDAEDCRRAIARLVDDPALRLEMGRAARASTAGRGWDEVVRTVTRSALDATIGAAA
ncbi:MAG: glycosyltransferase family 4 protein [Gammaproteobacteria bacterium]|nr:glycosyltransferase family 4 protein [Gammaproteobacteria bacterium]